MCIYSDTVAQGNGQTDGQTDIKIALYTLMHTDPQVQPELKIGGGQKWTSEVNDEKKTFFSGFIYMVLKSRDYAFKTIVLYNVNTGT